jgi:hypothetical protein
MSDRTHPQEKILINSSAINRPDDIEEIDTDELIELEPRDLPQEITESYGTGVHDQPGFSVGCRTLRDRIANFNEAWPALTGG